MYQVKLESDDFDGNGDAVKVANVVRAIAKLMLANGSTNKFQAERDAWPFIYTGVTLGKLHPFNPSNLKLCPPDNCTEGIVRFDELVEWGQWCKRFEVIDARGEKEKNFDFGYYTGIARHYGSIDWERWRLPYWTPREAACLMVKLDPKHYDSVKSSRSEQDRELADHIDATERMAIREQESGLLPDKVSPSGWLEWAQSKGRAVPDQLHEIARAGLPQATGGSGDAAGKGEAVKRGITKQQVINAFEGWHFDRDQWGKYLADPPDWLKECRVTPGVQGSRTSATWNPVLIAVALIDKGITPKKLDAVFVRLKDWCDEWREVSASFRD